MEKVIGISKAIETPETGAESAFHVIEYVQLDALSQMTTCTLNGYVSQAAKANGKRPLCSHTQSVPGLPAGEAFQWLYAQLVKPVEPPPEGMPVMPSMGTLFAGAALVHETPDQD